MNTVSCLPDLSSHLLLRPQLESHTKDPEIDPGPLRIRYPTVRNVKTIHSDSSLPLPKDLQHSVTRFLVSTFIPACSKSERGMKVTGTEPSQSKANEMKTKTRGEKYGD